MAGGKRAAVYARFSSDLQRDRSIDDQLALCTEFAARSGLSLAATFHDRARSGASVIGRDGLMHLMDAARDGAFDVLIVESLDRLSRDQEDLAGIWKRLSFLGIEIRAVHDGTADIVQIGIRGLVGALYLQDLAHKIRRGMSGRVRDGKNAGGKPYGYRPVPGAVGDLEIDDAEAETVRRIFGDYVGGKPVAAIVEELNQEGIAPPRGRFWRAATLNGNRKRGYGILRNPVYDGRIVWNRIHMVKHPDTGKRVSRANPESQWQAVKAPHLRIVTPEIFAAARARDVGQVHRPPERRAKHLLSGLIKCGCCGAGMAVKDGGAGRRRVMCAAAKAGACSNKRPFRIDRIETALLAGLREKLLDREAIEHYVRTYNAERLELARKTTRDRGRIEKKLEAARARHKRLLVTNEFDAMSDEEFREALAARRADVAKWEADLRAAEDPPKIVTLHTGAVDDYLRTIDDLAERLAEHRTAGALETSESIRQVIERVIVHPEPEGGATVEVKGRLAVIVGNEAFPAMRIRGVSMVAEDRFSPNPPGCSFPFAFRRAYV